MNKARLIIVFIITSTVFAGIFGHPTPAWWFWAAMVIFGAMALWE